MAFIFLLVGLLFYLSNGKASDFLSGYNMRSDEERKKYDEVEMCKVYGKRIMIWSMPFLVGAVIDFRLSGVGNLIAWITWVVMFILFLGKRHKMEK